MNASPSTTLGSPSPDQKGTAGGRPTPRERLVDWAAQVSERLPTPLRRIAASLVFEIRRTQTRARLFTWSVLALFPLLVVLLLHVQDEGLPDEGWGLILYGLMPQVVCLLGLLLWVAPLLQAELEGRTWSYLAVRPGGKLATLLGKYLNGVGWTLTCCWCGLALVVLVGRPDVSEPLRLAGVLALVIGLAAVAYGAVYAVIGAMFHRRAMVISVAYMLIFELLVSNIPAFINKLTVQHRLLNILFRLMDWRLPPKSPIQVGLEPAWFHLLILMFYTGLALTLSLAILSFREYVTTEEN